MSGLLWCGDLGCNCSAYIHTVLVDKNITKLRCGCLPLEVEAHRYNTCTSLGPKPKTNPSMDRFQYRVVLEAIYTPNEVWGQDYTCTQPPTYIQRTCEICHNGISYKTLFLNYCQTLAIVPLQHCKVSIRHL